MDNKEILDIKNFCGIKKAKIEISTFLVIIGPQASGKSIIAKLIFWMRMFLLTIFYEIQTGKSYKEVIESVENMFHKIFYKDDAQPFEIFYETGTIFIKISSDKTRKLKITHSENLRDLIGDLIKYQEKQKNSNDDEIESFQSLRKFFSKKLKNIATLPSISSAPIYIPATRSFFGQVDLSFFVRLAENNKLDPIMESFAEYLNWVKKSFGIKHNIDNEISINFLETLFSEIMNGQWIRKDNIDYINHIDGRKVPVSSASSAQQEIFPLCVILSHIAKRKGAPRTLIIEEPEAHLHPKAQKTIIEGIVHVVTYSSGRVILTTHSPYVLSAINNLYLAGQVKEKNPKSPALKHFQETSFQRIIKPQELSAYKLVDGEAICLINKETNLLDADAIDEVSRLLSSEFDCLLDAIEY